MCCELRTSERLLDNSARSLLGLTENETSLLLGLWVFVTFDTAGEVTFAGTSQSANQRVERALSVDTG